MYPGEYVFSYTSSVSSALDVESQRNVYQPPEWYEAASYVQLIVSMVLLIHDGAAK